MRAIGFALGGDLSAAVLVAATVASMQERGWTAEGSGDPAAWLDATVLRVEAEHWVVMEGTAAPPVGLVAEVAKRAEVGLVCHWLEVRDQAHPESDEGYWYQHSSFRVDPRGVRSAAPSALDELDPSEANFGDLGETVARLLAIAVRDEVADVETIDTLGFTRARLDLPPRLADLARQILDAGAWRVTVMGERRQAAVTLPDGSRRISVLTPEEVVAISAETGIAPA